MCHCSSSVVYFVGRHGERLGMVPGVPDYVSRVVVDGVAFKRSVGGCGEFLPMPVSSVTDEVLAGLDFGRGYSIAETV